MFKKTLALFLSALMLFAMGSAFAADAPSGEPIKIGVDGAITGAAPLTGLRTEQGARMAADEINAAGGVLGRPIELVVVDDGGTTDVAINAINKAISENVVAICGPTLSSLGLAVEANAKQAGIPILVGGTSPKLVKDIDNPYLFRIRASDTIQATIAATYARDTLGAKKIGVFHNSDDYGSGAMNVVKEFCEANGMECITEGHNSGDRDLTGQIMKLKGADVDAVIIWAHDAETAIAARQFYELGLDVPVVGSPTISTPQVTEMLEPEWIEGWNCVTDFMPSNDAPHVKAFVEGFEELYGETPELYAATYYGAIYLVTDAIERAGSTDGDAICEALRETDNLQGIVGTYKANENQEMVSEAIIGVLKDGKAQFLESVKAD